LRGDADKTDSLDALTGSTAPVVADALAETGTPRPAGHAVVVQPVLGPDRDLDGDS